MIGMPERRHRKPLIAPLPTPGPGDNHPFLMNPATPVERLFVQMSLAPAAVPDPSPLSFGENHYS